MNEPKRDFRSEMFWRAVIDAGPLGLLRHDFSAIEHELPEHGRLIFRRFLDGMEYQQQSIMTARKNMAEEGERIAHIGLMMQRAGLRSYTDEKGRIFVAARRASRSRGEEQR